MVVHVEVEGLTIKVEIRIEITAREVRCQTDTQAILLVADVEVQNSIRLLLQGQFFIGLPACQVGRELTIDVSVIKADKHADERGGQEVEPLLPVKLDAKHVGRIVVDGSLNPDCPLIRVNAGEVFHIGYARSDEIIDFFVENSCREYPQLGHVILDEQV